MFIEVTKSAYNKKLMFTGVFTGMLNAFFWIGIGLLIVSGFSPNVDSGNLYWWALFCLILNLGVSFVVIQQKILSIQKLFWVIGTTLFFSIVFAFIFGFWAAHGVTDWGCLALLGGASQGLIFGLVIGVIVGLSTAGRIISNITIIQRTSESIVVSTLVGLCISVISVFILATTIWTKSFIDSPNYPKFADMVFWTVLIISPIGMIPSVITGVTTSFAIHLVDGWLKKKYGASSQSVGYRLTAVSRDEQKSE